MKRLYCTFDTVAKECNAPFLANNDEHARAQFDQALSQVKQSGYKVEFKLLFLGVMDMETGNLISAPEIEDVTFTLKSEVDE